MRIINNWPDTLQVYLKDHGQVTSADKLAGIKDIGGCYRLRYSNTSIIVKEMIEKQEYQFYTKAAKHLKETLLHIPKLLWASEEEGVYYVVIEDIPVPLPVERRQADSAVLEVLHKFHLEMWNMEPVIEGGYQPKWERPHNEELLKLYSDKNALQLEPILIEAQKQAQQLFLPHCWINADTNPTNWGLRKDGTVVLFDWERISSGSPAIDIAITMPGLGTPDNSLEALIAKRYLEKWTAAPIEFPFNEAELLQQVKLAKIWSAVEFMSEPPESVPKEALQTILAKLSEKLLQLEL